MEMCYLLLKAQYHKKNLFKDLQRFHPLYAQRCGFCWFFKVLWFVSLGSQIEPVTAPTPYQSQMGQREEKASFQT